MSNRASGRRIKPTWKAGGNGGDDDDHQGRNLPTKKGRCNDDTPVTLKRRPIAELGNSPPTLSHIDPDVEPHLFLIAAGSEEEILELKEIEETFLSLSAKDQKGGGDESARRAGRSNSSGSGSGSDSSESDYEGLEEVERGKAGSSDFLKHRKRASPSKSVRVNRNRGEVEQAQELLNSSSDSSSDDDDDVLFSSVTLESDEDPVRRRQQARKARQAVKRRYTAQRLANLPPIPEDSDEGKSTFSTPRGAVSSKARTGDPRTGSFLCFYDWSEGSPAVKGSPACSSSSDAASNADFLSELRVVEGEGGLSNNPSQEMVVSPLTKRLVYEDGSPHRLSPSFNTDLMFALDKSKALGFPGMLAAKTIPRRLPGQGSKRPRKLSGAAPCPMLTPPPQDPSFSDSLRLENLKRFESGDTDEVSAVFQERMLVSFGCMIPCFVDPCWREKFNL